jgi:ubiquinone/menaquinone biosynthesis methyltransferase
MVTVGEYQRITGGRRAIRARALPTYYGLRCSGAKILDRVAATRAHPLEYCVREICERRDQAAGMVDLHRALSRHLKNGAPVSGRFVLKIGDHLENADTKRYYTERNFSEVAPRYDFITRVLSFGRDAAWKRALILLLPAHESPVCVDLACGTGDIAFLLAGKYPGGRIAGVDITEAMLDIARRRNIHPNVSFAKQDMGSLHIVSESVDIVTGGYALRNSPDLGTTIDEISRILKPRGVAAFLDFSKPGANVPRKIEYGVLKTWTGLWGVLLHRNHEVYSYIAESLQRFPDRQHLRNIFREKGFCIIDSHLFFGGITELLVVQKTARRAMTDSPRS